MVDEKMLEKFLRGALKTGKCIIGGREVSDSVKGSKLVVLSSSLPRRLAVKTIESCKTASVPVVSFQGSSVKLAQICGKNFRVSAIAVRSFGDVEPKEMMRALGEAA